MTTRQNTATLTLPTKHAADWLARYDGPEDGSPYDAEQTAHTARTITLDLGPHALADLVSDALYYSEEMDREATGDRDYRPPARALLRALERVGVTYTRRPGTFTVTVTGTPA